MEIEKALVISTGHIPESDTELLDESGNIPLPSVTLKEYGWIIALSVDAEIQTETRNSLEKLGFSSVLIKLVKLAQDNDVSFLIFDSDGQILDGFPTFEW